MYRIIVKYRFTFLRYFTLFIYILNLFNSHYKNVQFNSISFKRNDSSHVCVTVASRSFERGETDSARFGK